LAREGVDIQVQRAATEREEADRAVQEPAKHEADANEGSTIENMFYAWIVDGVRRKDGNAMLLRMLKADVLPVVGAIAVKEVTEHRLRAALRKMVDRSVNRSAVMTYANLVQMFACAHKRQPWRKLMVDGDPMDLIEIDKIVAPGYDMDNYRDRVPAPDEIRELRDWMVRTQDKYDAAPNERVAPQPLEKTTEHGIWIMLLTLCRVGEMSMARWEHVNLTTGEWFFPKANVKDNVADLTVYLSLFSFEQFKALHAGQQGATALHASRLCKREARSVGDSRSEPPRNFERRTVIGY
jgi:integrase